MCQVVRSFVNCHCVLCGIACYHRLQTLHATSTGKTAHNMKVSARAEPLLRSPVIDESSCVFARVYLDFLTGEDGRNVRG